MSYRIDFDHAFEQEIHRIAGKQISHAIHLLDQQPDGPHEAVHDARKWLKRTRALYRLIRSHAKEFCAEEGRRLGQIGDTLSGLRDGAALVEAAHYLQQKSSDKVEHQAIERIVRALEGERDRLYADTPGMDATIAVASSALGDAREAVATLKLDTGRKAMAKCLAAGWRHIDRKASEALALCADTTESVPFHELRKRSQDRWMHADVLHDLWPVALTAINNQTKALVDLLGHEHDLAVLGGKIAAADVHDSDEDRQAALIAILRERQTLQHACRDAARPLFDRRPKRDADIVELLVKNR